MAGIGPVSPNVSSLMPSSPAAQAAKPADGVDFTQTLRTCIERVDTDQQASAVAIGDLMASGGQDVLPAVAAVAKADMSFKLLMGVRNKMIEAYKQTMNMQV